MRKLLALTLVIMLLTGCSSAPAATPKPSAPEVPVEPPAPEIKMVADYPLTLTFPFGQRDGTFSGRLVDGIPNGNGKFSTHNPEGQAWWFDGEWVDGEFTGEGLQQWDGGRKDVGTFRNGRMYGPFKEYDQYDNLRIEGVMDDGAIISISESTLDIIAAFRDECIEIPYQDYARTPNDYLGAKIKVSGRVAQVIESDGYRELRIAVKKRYSDIIYASIELLDADAPRILERDKITVYGVFDGLLTYTSTMNAQITVPCMTIWDWNIG